MSGFEVFLIFLIIGGPLSMGLFFGYCWGFNDGKKAAPVSREEHEELEEL